MIEQIIGYIQPMVIEYGVYGVFIMTILEGVIAPIPSSLVPLMAGFLMLPSEGSIVTVLLYAFLYIALPVGGATILSSVAIYYIGAWGGRRIIERNQNWSGITWESIVSIEKKISRWGGGKVALFILTIIPMVPSALVSVFFGLIRYPLKTFIYVTFFAAFTKAMVMSSTGWYLGSMYMMYFEVIAHVENYVIGIVVGMVVLYGVYLIIKNQYYTLLFKKNTMFSIHSVAGRAFIGVVIGTIIGILSMLFAPMFGFSILSMFGFGTLMIFVMMGFTLGLVGVFDYHPVLKFKMRWWIRGAVAGFIFTLMYILLAHGSLMVVMQSNFVAWMGFQSPFWVLFDGVCIGLVMAWFETKFAGEGSQLPLE